MKSLAWGNTSFDVSQAFGKYSDNTAYMYPYAADLGWPAGTHVGLDVGMPRGTKIYAVQGGVVEQAGMNPYFRPMPVYLRQDDGDLAIYGHLWSNVVKVGDRVTKGQLLGLSGEQTQPGTMTPDGTGPHIHFELRSTDDYGRTTAIDPVPLLTGTTGVPDDSENPNYMSYTYGFSEQAGDALDSGIKWGTKIGAMMLGVCVIIAGIMVMSGAGNKIAPAVTTVATRGASKLGRSAHSGAARFNQARA